MARTFSENKKVHRVLFEYASGSAQRGADVKELQKAINSRLAARRIKFTRLKVDGIYGKVTHKAALRALYYLGITRKSVNMKTVNPTGLSHAAQQFIRLEKSRNKWQLARSKARVAAYTKARKKQPVTIMYDSIDLSQVPGDAPAVAGYTAGKWPTYPKIAGRFPKAKRLSIAIASRFNAECLDVEPGDATNSDAPGWVKHALTRGVKRPVLYTSASNVDTLVNLILRSGVHRESFRVWSAHYTHHPHICGRQCGVHSRVDATQWTNASHGRNLDESLLTPSFF